MFKFHGGQSVAKGTYWNLSNGERIDAIKNSELPGSDATSYVKLPVAGVFIAGPLAGLLFTCVIPFLFLLVTLLFLPRTIHASDAAMSEEAKACLGCHATPGMTKTFKDKSTLDVHVSESHFKNTVHGFLTCTGCHSDVSPDTHPASQYASKKEFMLHVAGACRTCHAEEQLTANPIHQKAITKANAPPCSECHGSHAIRKVPTQKEKLTTTQYCLTCHQQQLSMSINGETLSLSINEAGLRKSVHKGHGCTDCHTKFSKQEHPNLKFSSIREVSIAGAEACRRCHSDKSAQHRGSIHFDLLSKGNRNAPVCSDCHGAHAVGPKALAQTMEGIPCKKCHSVIFGAYQASVHGKAKTNGGKNAPICSSCHFAHDVKAAQASRSPKDLCLGCHSKVLAAHKEWLPNAGAHFDSVSCTVCHVSGEFKRTIYLRLTDGASGDMVTDSAMQTAMKDPASKTAGSRKVSLDPQHLWNIYQELNTKEQKVKMSGTVGLSDSLHAHYLVPKGSAVRQCEWCHTADSEFFTTISLTVKGKDGRETFYNVDSAAMGSLFAMLPLNQFYAIGSMRQQAFDIMGAVMIMGGLAVPVLHGSIRMLTARRRQAKQHNGPGRGARP
jgi:predicted CXXCH cytochrome family protein